MGYRNCGVPMTLLLRCFASLMLVSFSWMASPVAMAQELDIEFGFNNKPPLFYFEAGNAQGDVVAVVRQACKLASLRCGFTELPFLRVMSYLEKRRPGFAALGFSRTPERDQFVIASEPVWRDATPVLMVRAADKERFQKFAGLRDLIDNSQYTFGGKVGNVYPIDAFLKGLGPRDVRFTGEANRFPLLLVSERFDFTILYPEEILPALQASGIVPTAVATVHYPDIPAGQERYLLFSQAVSPDIVSKMNGALKKLRATGQIHSLR